MKSKYFLIFILFSIIAYWAFNPVYNTIEPLDNIVLDSLVENVDSTVTVTFSSVGDIMCHSTQYNYAWVEKDSFDFNPVFSVIGNYLRKKDILIGNLETVLAGDTKKYYGYPFFNSPNELAGALKNSGFDFLTTANNHSNDQGFEGVIRTLDELRKVNIIPLGTTSLDSVKNDNLFVSEGLRFGLLSYTYGTNYNENALRPKEYINHINPLKIKSDIENLKSKNADIVIVFFHFGVQYQKYISAEQNKIVDKTISYGADIILGSHPHLIQQFEKFETVGGNLDSGFVVYSLGNFISNQRWRYSDGGVIFNFNVNKNIFTDSVYVSDINYLPIWVFKGNTENGKEYIILPAQNYNNYQFITEEDADSMKKSYFDTISQLTLKSDFPKIDTLSILD